MSMTKIGQVNVGAGGSANIEFAGIPQIYTDLVISTSLRLDSDAAYGVHLRFNGVTSNYSRRNLLGFEGGALSFSGSDGEAAQTTISSNTSNTFSNNQIYIPNYRSAAAKSWSSDAVTENNAATVRLLAIAGLWNQTDAISTVRLFPVSGGNFVTGSSATLYGINRQQAIGKPKAIGGNITFSNGYWVHTFTGSGSFFAQEDLEVDALVVAGGGAGGSASRGGGGGAGGFRTLQSNIPSGPYLVLIGSGGAGYASGVQGSIGNSGASSSFYSVTSTGGGGGGAGAGGGPNPNGTVGQAGGSGGGGGVNGNSGQFAWAGGSGISGQGNSGGSSGHDHISYGKGGGGGGAGAAGTSITANGQTGTGGIGAIWNGSYYAGGGGGAGDGSNGTGPGGLGGGGNAGISGSPSGQAGTANTGGGGGAGHFGPAASGSGGSGIVIVRYPAD